MGQEDDLISRAALEVETTPRASSEAGGQERQLAPEYLTVVRAGH